MTNSKLFALLSAAAMSVTVQGARAADDANRTAASDKPQTHATESLQSCMNKWDPGTHMTKEAWRETCLRIRDERAPHVKDR